MYSWSRNKCIRYNDTNEGERHPCYWCGIQVLLDDAHYCDNCGGFDCPKCGKCWCNVPAEQFEALKTLRNKYCCTRAGFRLGIQDNSPDLELLKLVPEFKKALDYCRAKRRVEFWV